jgi:hypothetical protein
MDKQREAFEAFKLRGNSKYKPHDDSISDRHDWVVWQAAQAAQPAPTVPDNMQDWKGMDGTTAWHLIERQADNWADVGKMMGEWLTKNQAAQPAQVPPAHDSDCAQHNMPAYPNGTCDCSIAPVQVCVERGRVWIKRGVQSFMLAYEDEENTEWYANQLRKALSIIPPDVKMAAAPSTKEQSNDA